MVIPNRHRLYREHKYVCFVFSAVLKQVACMDFSNDAEIAKAKNELNNLQQLLQGHAEHEEQQIHRLLKLKQSDLYKIAEAQHQEHHIFFDHMATKFEKFEKANTLAEKNSLGHEIYLTLREFYADNLKHFDYEERVIMPELQRLYSDTELKEIDHASYRQMSSDEIFQMVSILFPYMNNDDRNVFLADIKACVPDKFSIAWPQISSLPCMSRKNNYFPERLFSYGTLQQEAVQLSTFGRKLNGMADVLLGYQLKDLEIKDTHVVAISGKAVHSVLMYTGNKTDEVKGTVFDISAQELAAADRYEVADYKRISVKLSSGITAWVYVSVDSEDK